MRVLVRVAIGTLIWFASTAEVTYRTPPVKFVAIDTHGPIAITALGLGVKHDRRSGRMLGNDMCVSFANRSQLDVTQVTFHFVYYDTRQDHAGDDELGRTGKFSPGVTISGNDPATRTFNDEDCVDLPDLPHDLSLAVVFVTHVTSVGGVNWSTSGPAIPQHLGGPDPTPEPAPNAPSPAADATP